ncbi:MAG: histidine kinase, partial [Planctomycetes bacterium]|nr:histidine kinase [Planctomycetota bacterium]
NNHPDLRVRMGQLCTAVRLVYASTFTQKARRYLEAAPYRVEEEKMAVMVQRLVGRQHGRYFYPDISGVAQSYNFYPFGPVRPEDGCAQVALGLGKAVVSGGDALRFCPKAPRVVPQLASPEVALRTTQRAFYALDLGEPRLRVYEEANLVELGLEVAEEHGVLDLLGGVYSEEDGVIRDGLQRPGQRLVTFGQVLRWDEYPLSRVLDEILRIGQEGMGCPVEIEFAASRPSQPGAPMEFSFLQLRPLAAAEREVSVSVDAPGADALCGSRLALGHGRLQGLCDVVYVSPARLDRSRTAEVAQEVGALNDRMARSRIPYVLIGPGRWGSTDPSLGIPVGWEQICGAKLIVETPLQGIEVEPSQGSHFFHNLTAMRIGYLTTGATRAEGAVDWAWLDRQNAVQENGSVRHVRLDGSLDIRIDGRTRRAVVLKPGVGGAEDNLVEAEP